MSSLNKSLAPDLIKSGVDEIAFSVWEENPMPQMADVTEQMVFKQDTVENGAINSVVFKDGGMWTERTDQQNLAEGNAAEGFLRTVPVRNFAQTLNIPKHFVDDENYGAMKELIRRQMLKGRLTNRREAFATYRNAFTTATTNQGSPLISTTHTNLNGDIVSNKLTAAFSEKTLDAMLQALVEQKDQSGDNVGMQPYCLFVPNRLFKIAAEVLDSDRKQGTANNDMNIYSAKYGIYLLQSNWIGALNGGSDTACFLLGKEHTVTRWVRQNVETFLVPPQYSGNLVYKYMAEFREAWAPLTYEGIVATDGTTPAL